jgi:two-component system NtrC family sensor kinase
MSQAVAAGDLDQHINIRRADEIGELAVAFDQMTLNLRARTEEAARLYAETVQRNTELAEINARLQAAQLQLVQSEKLAAIGQLTAGIVHDVKNPVGAIKGLAELTQDEDDLSPETRQAIDMIYDSAVKAETIVSDLLKFARQSEMEMKRQDLRERVNVALRLTDYLIRKGNLKLVTDLPDEPVEVACDSQQIEQVLVNMIDNAVHAMPEGGTLRINLSQVSSAAAIAIQDSGKGIEPEHLRRIFDPFFTTKPEGEGTGLGLSVSYGIISSHNGRIDVESEVGEGTTFTILLPVDQLEIVENET